MTLVKQTIFSAIALIVALMANTALAQVPTLPCNFVWAGNCYQNLADAEVVMRGTTVSHALLEPYNEDDDYVYYYLESTPSLPTTSWRGMYYYKYSNGFDPLSWTVSRHSGLPPVSVSVMVANGAAT